MAATLRLRPTLTFDLLTLKSVWESHVTWGTPVQSFVFLGLLVFELEPMYATSDRQTDGRTTDADDRPPTGRGIIRLLYVSALGDDDVLRDSAKAGYDVV